MKRKKAVKKTIIKKKKSTSVRMRGKKIKQIKSIKKIQSTKQVRGLFTHFNVPVLVGNWKMNPESLSRAKTIFSSVATIPTQKGSLIVAPPLIFARDLMLWTERSKKGLGIIFAAQDAYMERTGPFTGRISADMLADTGFGVVILGHSEMRAAGDTDEIVNAKMLHALNIGLGVVVCIGEHERHDDGRHLESIRNQLIRTLRAVPAQYVSKIAIAYEPLWAIGTGNAIAPNDLHEMVLYIKKLLQAEPLIRHLAQVPLLYGGSVTPQNAGDFISDGMADGVLVGKQSLDPQSFIEIYHALQHGQRVKDHQHM